MHEQTLHALAKSAMDEYRKRFYELTGERRYLYDRRCKSIGDGKHYSVFVGIIMWSFGQGFDVKDYISVMVPIIPSRQRRMIGWLNTSQAKEIYLKFRQDRPQNTTLHANNTEADTIRTTMAASIETIKQHQALFGDYGITLKMSGPALSPEFLATDRVFLSLIYAQQVSGPYCARVSDVLKKCADEPAYLNMLQGIRNEQLSIA